MSIVIQLLEEQLAILLNDDFYNFMLQGLKIINDICVLGAEYLIPFKMYAWLDLKNKKQNGEHVNEKDLKKHKYKEEAITILHELYSV